MGLMSKSLPLQLAVFFALTGCLQHALPLMQKNHPKLKSHHSSSLTSLHHCTRLQPYTTGTISGQVTENQCEIATANPGAWSARAAQAKLQQSQLLSPARPGSGLPGAGPGMGWQPSSCSAQSQDLSKLSRSELHLRTPLSKFGP